MLQIHQHTNDGTLHTSLIIANIKHEVRMDEFLRMAAGLKKIPRQGWIDKAGISNPESVADHSYSMTVMAMMFGDNAGMDTCKMIRMALLHDIVESITGDLTPEMTSKENKLAQEKIAIEKITRMLPEPLRTKYSELWSEYSARKSADPFVHEVKLGACELGKHFSIAIFSWASLFSLDVISGVRSPVIDSTMSCKSAIRIILHVSIPALSPNIMAITVIEYE